MASSWRTSINFSAVILVLSFTASASPLYASPLYRVEVIGESAAGDQVGALLLDAVRARVGRFSGMTLDSRGDRFLIEVATLDPDSSSAAGNRTAYSVTYVMVDGSVWRYMAHSVGICGASRVEQVALGIVSNLGKMISALASVQGAPSSPPPLSPSPPRVAKLPPEKRDEVLQLMTKLASVRTTLAAPHPDFPAICSRAREIASSLPADLGSPSAPQWRQALGYIRLGAEACGPASRLVTISQFALAKEQLQVLVSR
jgi:hypothetical protein